MKIDLKKSDLYLVGIFFLVAIPVTFSGYDYSKGLREPILDTIIYVVFSIVVTYIIVLKLFPYFFPKGKILALFFVTALVMSIFGMLELYLYEWVDGDHVKLLDRMKGRKFDFFSWGVSSSAQNAGILVGVLLGKKFYEAQLDIEKRDKEMKESELRLLKSQIDPHFLFNNLNTVDALIDNKPQIAKEYLQRLAQLYRYLIRTKDDEVIGLEEELSFARNYIYLLEHRYGKAYTFNVEGTIAKNSFIPPGALQTLLENVVKHNIGKLSDPVITSIILENDQIIVSNNLAPKEGIRPSTKTGLENLRVRYSLLSDKSMQVTKDENFTVVLPLIMEVDS